MLLANSVYVAWQDSASRSWNTVARLTRNGDRYEFAFTRGADKLNSIPKDLFRLDINERYRSNELISLFKNKLPPRSRADFKKMANWLNLSGDEPEFDLLSKFGLIPGSDSILVYPSPDIVDSRYSLEFFVHGIRHMHADVMKWCDEVEAGFNIAPLLDVQNPVDPNAVALKSPDGTIIIGYIPAFYAADFRALLQNPELAKDAKITVVRNNRDAPVQLRLLCRFTSKVPNGFKPLDTPVHQLVRELA
jgi:hypothetical protein